MSINRRDPEDDYTGADFDDALDQLPPRKWAAMETVHLPDDDPGDRDE